MEPTIIAALYMNPSVEGNLVNLQTEEFLEADV